MTKDALQKMKDDYNLLINRIEKGIRYYEDEEVPLLEKMDHWPMFVELLKKTADMGRDIVDKADQQMTPAEWCDGFKED